MKINKALLVALVLSLVLAVVLISKGWQSGTVEIPPKQEIVVSELNDEDLMALVEKSLAKEDQSPEQLEKTYEVCEQARLKSLMTNDHMLAYAKIKIANTPAPMEGIFMLREILKNDSNHVATIEALGQMSVQTGQWEKAKKRYQKLLSLQPENTEYRQMLTQICQKLGDSDCL